jgi:hypothetical protein
MEQATNWHDLGARVMNAARLAVAMHLHASVQPDAGHRQIVIGGAGPRFVTDDGEAGRTTRMEDRG